ncbi:hypothetical protein [Aeromonas veronii]|uniref:hypothetical protein n=1 Tax=Aeromonas veronii TaxID=654 RepID=UPI003BA01AA1
MAEKLTMSARERNIIQTYGLTIYSVALLGMTRSKVSNLIRKFNIQIPSAAEADAKVFEILKEKHAE